MLTLGFVLRCAPAVWAQSMGDPSGKPGDGPTLDDLMPLAKSILFPGTTVVSSRSLVAAGVADKSLRDARDLQINVLTLENGQQELQSHMTPRANFLEEIAIRPGLETGTYTVEVTPVDRDTLEREGLLER